MLNSSHSTPSVPHRDFLATPRRSTIRANTLKAASGLPDLALYLLAEWTAPRLRNPAPVLIFSILVAGRHNA
jgi:hypothetical protein